MKLSLAWIFDHIVGNKADILTADFVAGLVELLGARVTEIEGITPITYDLELFTLAQVISQTTDSCVVMSPELKKEFKLSLAKNSYVGAWYLLVRHAKKEWEYATLQDVQSTKDGLMPDVWCSPEEVAGDWKKRIHAHDFIIAIDNKAITHRPDLWGHRGFAREVAALYNFELRSEEQIGVTLPIKHFKDTFLATTEIPFAMSIAHKQGMENACKRLAACFIRNIAVRPSIPWIAFRLATIDSRPLNSVVDLTNYVMFDIGQPMHAFDSQIIAGHTFEARCARENEVITLLDDKIMTLSPEDCVIADAKKPLALAGIMGGKQSGILPTTKSLLVESANFDADAIRLTSARYGLRTEASARFEKSLDPHQNTCALLRYMKLLDDNGICYEKPSSMVSLGDLTQEHVVEVSHEFIIARIGVPVACETIVAILTKLGFGVVSALDGYAISIPTYRGKDVVSREDIVEEIARLIGYDNIPLHLPVRTMNTIDQNLVFKMRTIKQHCAFGMSAHEVSNYAFYDEDFIKRLAFEPQQSIAVKNPVSEHWRRLVTSLIPHLLKNVVQNIPDQENIRLFEINKTWQYDEQQLIAQGEWQERNTLGLLLFAYKKSVDFYEGKAYVQSLFDALKILVVWQKVHADQEFVANNPWILPEQTARLYVQGRCIGYAGKISPRMMHRVAEGDAFIAELDMDFMMQYIPELSRYHALSRYQSVDLDISMLVPVMVTVDDITAAIVNADGRIIDVRLHDFFENESWKDMRSITMRFTISDMHKTLTKEEIDEVWTHVVANVVQKGAQIR